MRLKSGNVGALKFLMFFVVAFVAAAFFGTLIRAVSSSDEQVKVIVYVKEGAHEKQFVGVKEGFAPASVSIPVNSRSVLASIPESDISGKHAFSSFDGFTATLSKAEYERLKSDTNLEVFDE